MSNEHTKNDFTEPFSQSELRSIAVDMVTAAHRQKLAFRQSPLVYAEYIIESMGEITGINFTWAPEDVHKLLPHLSIQTCGELFGVVVDWKGRSLSRVDPPNISSVGALDQASMLNSCQIDSKFEDADLRA